MNFEKFKIGKENYMDYAEWRNRLPRDPFPAINVEEGSNKKPSTTKVVIFDPEKHGYKGTLLGRAIPRQSEKHNCPL